MYRISMHYYCTDHTLILDQILHREKKAIQGFEKSLSLNKEMFRVFGNDDNPLDQQNPLDNYMETVIVKKWDNVLSVYPLLCTAEQIANESWVKHDTRRSGVAQKHASLFVGQNDRETHVELWMAGEFVCGMDIATAEGSLLTVADLCEKNREICDKWHQASPDGHSFDALPLFLPPDWREIWPYRIRSTYVIECQSSALQLQPSKIIQS